MEERNIQNDDYFVMIKNTVGLEPMKPGDIFRVCDISDSGIVTIEEPGSDCLLYTSTVREPVRSFGRNARTAGEPDISPAERRLKSAFRPE